MVEKVAKKRVSRKKVAQEKAQKWITRLNTAGDEFLISLLDSLNNETFFEKVDELSNNQAPIYIAVIEYCIARYRDKKYPKASGINYRVALCPQCKKLYIGDTLFCTKTCFKNSMKKSKIEKLREELKKLEVETVQEFKNTLS